MAALVVVAYEHCEYPYMRPANIVLAAMSEVLQYDAEVEYFWVCFFPYALREYAPNMLPLGRPEKEAFVWHDSLPLGAY